MEEGINLPGATSPKGPNRRGEGGGGGEGRVVGIG